MGRILLILVVAFSAWPIAAAPSNAQCKRLEVVATATDYPSIDEIRDILMDDGAFEVNQMVRNAVGYLSQAKHFAGVEKAMLWEQFAEQICFLKNRFTSEEQPIHDVFNARVFRGDIGHMIIFDIKTGQMYRAQGAKLPYEWTIERALKSGEPKLTPIGKPSDIQM